MDVTKKTNFFAYGHSLQAFVEHFRVSISRMCDVESDGWRLIKNTDNEQFYSFKAFYRAPWISDNERWKDNRDTSLDLRQQAICVQTQPQMSGAFYMENDKIVYLDKHFK